MKFHDVFLNLGPFGGICSAFQKDPNCSLVGVGNRLCLLWMKNLVKLVIRNTEIRAKVATAIKGKGNNFRNL